MLGERKLMGKDQKEHTISAVLVDLFQGSGREDRVLCDVSTDDLTFRWMRKTDYFRGYNKLVRHEPSQLNNDKQRAKVEKSLYKISSEAISFDPANAREAAQAYDEIFPKHKQDYKLVIATVKGALLTCFSLWIERQAANDSLNMQTKVIGHFVDIKIDPKFEHRHELLIKIVECLEGLAWACGCTDVQVSLKTVDIDILKAHNFH